MPSRKRTAWEQRARGAEADYLRDLRKLVRSIKQRLQLALGADYQDLENVAVELENLGENIDRFAEQIANNMLRRVNRGVIRIFEQGGELSTQLKRQLVQNEPIALRYQELVQEQILRIKGIPQEVADDIRAKAFQYQTEGLRSDDPDLIRFIEERSGVAESRARMIARTQVSACSTALVQARSEHVGSAGYIWSTSHDAIVRPSHQKMDQQYVSWSTPPTLDGLQGHAGELPNCRCTPLPILPNYKFS